MEYWKTEEYQINHIGWLLAADAPANIAKGKKLLAEASPEIQEAAKARAKYLVAHYATARWQKRHSRVRRNA